MWRWCLLVGLGFSLVFSAQAATVPDCWQQSPTPVRVLVAYYSAEGSTATMAAAVMDGARQAQGCVLELRISDDAPTTQDYLLAADAIVLGSPVYNGNAAAPLLAWIQTWPFAKSPLRDKVGAAFVSAGGLASGQESVLFSLQRSLLAFNMLIVGGDHWQTAYGATYINQQAPFNHEPNRAAFIEQARALGARVVQISQRLK